jgi:hypothetical protein
MTKKSKLPPKSVVGASAVSGLDRFDEEEVEAGLLFVSLGDPGREFVVAE